MVYALFWKALNMINKNVLYQYTSVTVHIAGLNYSNRGTVEKKSALVHLESRMEV